MVACDGNSSICRVFNLKKSQHHIQSKSCRLVAPSNNPNGRRASSHGDLWNIKRVNLSVTAERLNWAHSSIQKEADFIIDKSDSSIQSLFPSVCAFPSLCSPFSLCFPNFCTLPFCFFTAFPLLVTLSNFLNSCHSLYQFATCVI